MYSKYSVPKKQRRRDPLSCVLNVSIKILCCVVLQSPTPTKDLKVRQNANSTSADENFVTPDVRRKRNHCLHRSSCLSCNCSTEGKFVGYGPRQGSSYGIPRYGCGGVCIFEIPDILALVERANEQHSVPTLVLP